MAQTDIAAILKEVRRIQIVANRQVNDLLAGEYQSAFKGRGMVFDEVREYVPGDEIRAIDWNVTARMGHPYIKRYCEERELTVMMAVDISASGMFGSRRLSKIETAAQVAAVLMFSALKNNDKVGLVLFANGVRRFVPPRKGRSHVLRLIREMLATDPVREPTDIGAALEYLARVQRRRAVVFVLSDFLGEDCSRALAVANQRHDVVAVSIGDPREYEMPDVGFVTLEDAETGEILELDTRHEQVRALFAKQAAGRQERLTGLLRRSGIDRLDIRTDRPYGQSLMAFFKMRERRFR
ncbi:MAG: DUF58 domain-containing protein [Planctomycetota bacterium]|nr:DUF58 domain-containing protein [Planctomycetota bacterium]